MHRIPLADEIKRWLKNGGKKRRSLTSLARMTDIHRNTLKAASEGKSRLTALNAIRILHAVSPPERVLEIVHDHMPELEGIAQMITDTKAAWIAPGGLSETECKVLTDVVFTEPAVDAYIAHGATAAAVDRLVQMNCIEPRNGKLAALSKVLVGSTPVVASLVKFAAKKLNLDRSGNSATVWMGNCDDATKQEVLALMKDIELRTAELIKRYKPGPHKVALVSFATDLGD